MVHIILGWLCESVFASQMLLADARNLVNVIPYTLEEKVQVADGILNIVQGVSNVN